MPVPTCPMCDAEIKAPQDRQESLEDSVECPGCGRPLTWYFDDRSGGRWIVDEIAEGRRRMTEGPGDIESPAAT